MEFPQYRPNAQDAVAAMWPVGSVFISVVDTDPSILLGIGTWQAFGSGRVLVGKDAGQTEFDTLEETGGAKEITLTAAQMPAHTHALATGTGATGNFSQVIGTVDTSSGGTGGTPTQTPLGTISGSTGGGSPHPNLPPYIVVRFWKRIA